MRTKWIEARKGSKIQTQMHFAKKGIITEEMRFVADFEKLDAETVRAEIAAGKMIIPANINHPHLVPLGIGRLCTCKINANIGNSSISSDKKCEVNKVELAIKYGADAVMDLSTGENIDEIRRSVVAASTVPVGTVPMYEAAEMVDKIEDLTTDQLFKAIERHAEQGVDFITVHCGLLRKHVPLATERICKIVSRGGSLLAKWMQENDRENPLYDNYDRLLEICQRYDMTLSLGDGLRPGCLADASDCAQFAELEVLGELTRRAREADVQVMVEGPGHVPFDQIEMNIKKQIEICDGAPFYVLGPLVTDIAAGYDHITSAIGGTMAAFSGASMLCYVTPKEHLGLPNAEDVRVGVVAHKIAAHAADVALKRTGARDRDDGISKARFALDWKKQFEFMLDSDRAKEYLEQSKKFASPENNEPCSMCGPKFCAMKISKEVADKQKNK